MDATQLSDEGLRNISREAQRYDAICDQVIEMNALVKALVEKIPQGHTQTVIHKTQGMGAWGAAAVVACFATWIGITIATVILSEKIDKTESALSVRIDKVEAWNDISRKDIARLQAQQENHK